jgi:hypothetical protein
VVEDEEYIFHTFKTKEVIIKNSTFQVKKSSWGDNSCNIGARVMNLVT